MRSDPVLLLGEKILQPLQMNHTVYSIADMLKQPDYGLPFTERRDSMELYKIPYYEDTEGLAAAGAIISNIEDMSHWLIALMNNGQYGGKQVLPPKVLQATLEPAIALPNAAGQTRGWWEVLNPYDLNIVHRSGRENTRADALSR